MNVWFSTSTLKFLIKMILKQNEITENKKQLGIQTSQIEIFMHFRAR